MKFMCNEKRARDRQVSASVTLSYISTWGEEFSAAAIKDVISRVLSWKGQSICDIILDKLKDVFLEL